MDARQIIESLSSLPGAEALEDGHFRFAVDGDGTFYFGEEGERVTIARVREVILRGDLVELVSEGERAFFPCGELIGFKVKVRDAAGQPGRTGFRR